MKNNMHRKCCSAPFNRVFNLLFTAILLVNAIFCIAVHAEGRGGADFPPEVDYPEDAYDADEREDSEYLQPRDKRNSGAERPPEKRKRIPRERPRARVEKTPIPSSEPSSPHRWYFDSEFLMGLNQSSPVPAIDPDRDTVGLAQSFLTGGKISLYRNSIGVEADVRYAFTPQQEVITDDGMGGTTTELRSLSTLNALFGVAYRYRGWKQTSLVARAGYGIANVGINVEVTGATIPHGAKVSGFYLGAGLSHQWNPWWSSHLDIYQSLTGSGIQGPTAATSSSGFGFMRIDISNRVRLMHWGTNESPVSFGAGLMLTYLAQSSPTPPTGNLVGESEKFMQALGTAFLSF